MRTIPIIILTLLTSLTFGQQRTIEKELLEIIKTALSNNQLPNELINNTDSLFGFRGVAIESTDENKLKTGETLKWDKVELWVWGIEYMFDGQLYWLTPSKIKISDTKAALDFRTNSWSGENVKCYKGTIKAIKKDGRWTISSLKQAETTNSAYTQLKERYEREKKKKKIGER